MTKKSKNKYNHYSEDFRREAVRRSEGPDTSAAVARKLGIHPGKIYCSRRQYNRLSKQQMNSMKGVDYSKDESENCVSFAGESCILRRRMNS